MLRRNLRKSIAGSIICITVLLVISPSVFATEPHQNPEIAEQVFSGISLLRYYSGSLDFVLQKNPAEVEARLEKMPLANILQRLEESADDFATSSINIAHLVVEIDKGLGNFRALMGQFRLSEAANQAVQISAGLYQANNELRHIEQAVETTGKELRVFSALGWTDLRRSYDELLERIERIREMLALYQKLLESTGITIEELLEPTGITIEELLESTGITIEELLESTGITIEELLESTGIAIEEALKWTDITLKVQPTVAFVGDNISFEGVLTSEGKPLAGREVDVLLNGSRYVTIKTDAYGHYQGRLQVPYWYISELDLQALYYPRDRDTGIYLASLSPVIKLNVLFYEANLEIAVEDKAYPGLETVITGRFNYGQSPPLRERKTEVYFDDVLIAEVLASEEFAQEIKVDSEVDVGKHVITVSAVPVGRYSPVVANTILNVTKASPILDIGIPKVAMIPGSIGLGGRLYSEVGPLNEALIRMKLGKSQVELVGSEDGAFDTKIGVGMGFGLIGSQDLVIQVLPQEPWHTPLFTTKSLVIVNMVNCGSILIILVFLGVYLRRRFQRRLGVHLRRRPPIAIPQPEPAPTYSKSVLIPISAEESGQTHREPKDRIYYWYRFVVRVILGITKALLKPQQTLREFANESGRVLGPATRYFIELTRLVERLLYSRYQPTETDVEKSQQLSHSIEEGLKGESI